MRKIKVYSVRLKNLTPISPKCWKAEDWQGNTYLIPDSQYFGQDYDVSKSEAHWIAAWILERSSLTFSRKKVGWYNPNNGQIEPPITITIEHHIPERFEPVTDNTIQGLRR